MKIAVVGGGISGLTAAYLLSRAGHEVTCVDRSERPGGLLRSERRDGFLCETGPQGVLDGAPEVRALLEDVGLAGRAAASARGARKRYVYARGRLRAVPSGPFSLMSSDLLSASGKWRLLQEPRAKALETNDDESVFDFAARRIGPEAAEMLVAPAVIGVFAGDAAKLSIRSAFPRLAALEAEHGSMLRGLRAARRQEGGPGKLVSFPDGVEELPRALAQRLGARISHAHVTAVAREGGAWRLQTSAGPLACDRVVLAVGPRVAAPLIAPHAPVAAGRLSEIPLASVVVVWLGFDTAPAGMDLEAYGFLVARGEGPTILGCQYDSSTFPGRAPPGGTLLRVIMGGTFEPRAVDEPDDALVARALADVRTVTGLGSEPTFRAAWRHREVLPQYELGHPARVSAVDEALAAAPGLHLLGVSLRGVGISDCIRNATALAREIGAA